MRAWQIAPTDIARAVDQLVGHGRPWAALSSVATIVHKPDDDPPADVNPDLVIQLLEAMFRTVPSEAISQMPGYEIGILLDYLESQGLANNVLAGYEFQFFRLLEQHRRPRALFSSLARNPAAFVGLVRRVYRGKNEPKRQLTGDEEALALHAWWVLENWDSEFPGCDDGEIDAVKLNQWVREARNAFAELSRADIGDEQIGLVLARSPMGADGIWPAEAVRELIEEIGSESIETGLYLGAHRTRGVTSRGVYDGGQQEREIAGRYHEWERQTAGRWRRTSRVLRAIAESLERDARFHDDRASLAADIE